MSIQVKRKTPLSQLIAAMTEGDMDFQRVITTRTYHAGETIAEPNDLSSKVFILMNGKAQLVCQNKEGRRMTMARIGPGAVFGDGAISTHDAASTTFAEALEDSTVWMLPETHARVMTERYPIISWGMLQTFGRRLRQVEDRLEEVAYKKLPQRLAKLLLDLAPSNDEDAIQASHQSLADMLGTYRETVSTILRGFKADGIVDLGYRQIYVTDPHALQALASSWE